MASSSCEEQQQPVKVKEKECVHKTKTIQFFGRTTPIILQNDNGPCPLLAICNILLLKNEFDMGSDSTDVSQQKLLTLVAEKLIDLDSNIDNKDEGFVENQQQNISDAIDLLPRLTTGIDVNVKFRRIDDFEFTPECAIYDLLGIPLCHGWIVDPQDKETAEALGSKSYNALTGELVALETGNMETEHKTNPEEDDVDFVAATTATLGVPSPCLSNSRSFDESPRSATEDQKERKGDLEEEAELLKALKMSESEVLASVGDSFVADSNIVPVSSGLDEFVELDKAPMHSAETLKKHDVECNNFNPPDPTISFDCNASRNGGYLVEGLCLPLKADDDNNHDQPAHVEPTVHNISVVEKSGMISSVQIESAVCTGVDITTINKIQTDIPHGGKKINNTNFETNGQDSIGKNIEDDTKESCLSAPKLDTDLSSSFMLQTDASEALTSTVEGCEPMYEGEECVLSPATTVLENREPVYEGEVVLTEQANKGPTDVRPRDEITPQEGELIRNFLKNNASQLTFYGLFCLQDGLKERELCVFFRNNHFSTMFKFNGELYLLATDQGYLNQPDLVWEKLNEVNGDTIFMTGNFKEFKVENHGSDNWDENHAMASTADYLASIDTAGQTGLDVNSDLQLAIALQQQEFDQQPQRQNVQQSSVTNNSRLITGPQVPRNGGRSSTISASSRPEAKSKDKCSVM